LAGAVFIALGAGALCLAFAAGLDVCFFVAILILPINKFVIV